MREDMLKGIIIPPKAIPNDVHSGFGGRSQQGDPAGMYRWVAQHGDSTRARRNKHITEAVRDRAAASFPMAEKRKEEGRKAKATEKTKFSKRIEYVVEGYRQLETGKKDCNIPWVKFMHRCWKELNYAATFGSGPLEHRDLKKYEEAFVSPSNLLALPEQRCADHQCRARHLTVYSTRRMHSFWCRDGVRIRVVDVRSWNGSI